MCKDHRLCLLFLRRLQQIRLGYADGREVELAAEAMNVDSVLVVSIVLVFYDICSAVRAVGVEPYSKHVGYACMDFLGSKGLFFKHGTP